MPLAVLSLRTKSNTAQQMTKSIRNAYLCLAAMAATFITACNGDDMLLSYQHTVQIGIYSTHTHADTVLTQVQIYGVGREDSLLYDAETLSDAFLNLNLKRDTTEYIFRTQTLQDNLFIRYRKSLEPVSGSGGLTINLHIDSIGYTNTFIDSIAIVRPGVNYNESLENVQIFVY